MKHAGIRPPCDPRSLPPCTSRHRSAAGREGYSIGVLNPGTLARPSLALEAFRERLRELGYVEGRNIAMEYQWAEGRPERFPDLAAELVRLKVDVIVAGSFPGARAAKEATSTIPIVTISADP